MKKIGRFIQKHSPLVVVVFFCTLISNLSAAEELIEEDPLLNVPVKFLTWGIDLEDVELIEVNPMSHLIDVDFFSEDATDFDAFLLAVPEDVSTKERMAKFMGVDFESVDRVSKYETYLIIERYYIDLDKSVRFIAFSKKMYSKSNLDCRSEILVTFLQPSSLKDLPTEFVQGLLNCGDDD